jgi:hypothetical protein
MSRHLLFGNGVGAILELNRGETTSGDYGQLYDAFQEQAEFSKDHYVGIVVLDPWESHAGVFWDWELAGPAGASYRIHILPDTAIMDVAKCIHHIRRSYDCVRLTRNRIKRLIDLRMPAFRHDTFDMRTGTLIPGKVASEK